MPVQRPRDRVGVLSVVERGWRGARECSLTLSRLGIPVTHLIKGYLNASLRAIIPPYPNVRLVSLPRTVFRIGLWGVLIVQMAQRRIHWVLVDNDRTLKQVAWWCRMLGLIPIAIRETADGYELHVNGKPSRLVDLFQPFEPDASCPRI